VNDPLERTYFRLRTTYTLSNYPIHFAGATLFCINASSEAPATISIDESSDGDAWTPVLFSTHANSGLASFTFVEKACAVITFTSPAKYVRFSLDGAEPEGVFCHLVQYPPKAREAGGYG